MTRRDTSAGAGRMPTPRTEPKDIAACGRQLSLAGRGLGSWIDSLFIRRAGTARRSETRRALPALLQINAPHLRIIRVNESSDVVNCIVAVAEGENRLLGFHLIVPKH